MHPTSQEKFGFLKCYYGYQNLGDELLFFGVTEKLFGEVGLEKLIVEVGNKQRFETRLTRHADVLGGVMDQIQLHQIWDPHTIQMRKALKIFGGGEVITDDLSTDILPGKPIRNFLYTLGNYFFSRSGWNYVLQYRKDIFNHNVVRIGGIGKARKRTTQLLYLGVLPRARAIICRDRVSYRIAKHYFVHTELAQDFAIPVIQRLLKENQEERNQRNHICLITIAGKAHIGHKIERILEYIKHLPADTEYIYLPMDLRHDRSGAEQLKYALPALRVQDRSGLHITEIVRLFAQAQRAIGDRLHFGILAQQCGCDFTVLSSSDKIRKFFDKKDQKSILE